MYKVFKRQVGEIPFIKSQRSYTIHPSTTPFNLINTLFIIPIDTLPLYLLMLLKWKCVLPKTPNEDFKLQLLQKKALFCLLHFKKSTSVSWENKNCLKYPKQMYFASQPVSKKWIRQFLSQKLSSMSTICKFFLLLAAHLKLTLCRLLFSWFGCLKKQKIHWVGCETVK